MAILLTGAAGFIGFHVAEALLARGEQVIGVDSLNDYYDPRLKQARLDRLQPHAGFAFHRLDISDRNAVGDLIRDNKEIDRIIHLAAQAGVRHSLVDPYAYVQANVMGHLVILEAARRLDCRPGMLAARARIGLVKLQHRHRAALIGQFVEIDGKQRRCRPDTDRAHIMAVYLQDVGGNDVLPTMILEILGHARSLAALRPLARQ